VNKANVERGMFVDPCVEIRERQSPGRLKDLCAIAGV
jgi:hypothetical protein